MAFRGVPIARRAVVVLLLAAFAAPSCDTGPEFAPPREGERLTLGELVYEILHQNLQRAETCGPELADTLAVDRERFVSRFDYAISEDVVDSLPELLGGTILPVVDSGDLPQLTDALADAMAVLVDDELDPERTTLTSALEIAQTRTVLESSQVFELVRRVLADPQLPERIHALAGLAQERAGPEDVVTALLHLAARQLRDLPESRCAGIDTSGLRDAIFRTEGYVRDPSYGAPAWSVRADPNGNPAVRPSAIDGRLPAPFVDADRDGVPDVDERGRPVDADGAPIDLPAFGSGEAYDAEGLRLSPDGGHLYDYFDVKQTTLGHVLDLGRDALEAEVHHDTLAVLEAVLGAPEPCDEDDACEAYPSDDHPVADAAHTLLEIGRYERAKTFLDTVTTILQDDPALAEDLLVSLGDAITALEETDLSLTDTQLIDTGVDLLPLLDDVFATSAPGEESTPRLLLQTIVDLGETSRDFPDELAYIVDYRELHKDDECSDEAPDLARSVAVDYDMPRTFRAGGEDVDNRSALEQTIELLDTVECGDVPFSGDRTVAYVVLDLMADLRDDQVCTVIDLLLGVLDVLPLASDFVISGALDLIGCDGDAVVPQLRALDALAKSGGLDFLLPLAKVFDERGQLDLLIDILQFVAEDLRLEEDGDPGTKSVVRRLLPALSEILATDLPDVLFDLLDRLLEIEASDGDGTLADVMIDGIAYVIDDDGLTRTRDGNLRDTSLLRELLLTAKELVTRIRTRRATDDLDRLLDHVTGYVTRTTTEDGRRVLANRNLLPMVNVLLEEADVVAGLPRADYECWLDEVQDGAEDALTSRDLAALMRIGAALRDADEGPEAEAWLREMITPGDPETELYGPLLEVLAGLAGSEVDSARFDPVLRWLGDVAKQRTDDASEILQILDRILQSDDEGAMLAIASNFVAPYETGEESDEAPALTYAGIFDSVTDVDTANMCAVDPDLRFEASDAEETLLGIVEFMRDEEQGLGAIYALIGQRRDGPTATRPPAEE